MTASSPVSEQISQMQKVFARQKDTCRASPFPDYDNRIADLSMLKRALLTHKQALCDAMSADYGHRSQHDSLIADILPCVLNINYTRRKLKRWMKPSRRNPGLLLHPASVSVHYQPKGVVGIIVPWNFPVMLSIGPLITALAAGNRVMLKLSEFTPQTNRAIARMLGRFSSRIRLPSLKVRQMLPLPFPACLLTTCCSPARRLLAATLCEPPQST